MAVLTPYESAIAAAKMGWKVFPLRRTPVGKWVPRIKDWENNATGNQEIIEAWNASRPTEMWGLACEPSGLFALDIDRKSGKNPDRALDSLPLLPPTFTVKTPTGGEHYIYKGSGPSSVQAIGEGLDTRGRGGYVVLFGSVRDDGPYIVIDPRLPLDAPAWLVEKVSECAKQKAVLPSGVSVQQDSPSSIMAAIELLKTAPPAIEGEGGDLQTFRTACHLRDLGIGPENAFCFMAEFYNPRCSPPWDRDELQAKVANAYRYGKNDPGVASPEAFFSKVEVAPVKLPTLVDAQTWADTEPPPVDPLVADLFDMQDKVAIIGPSKTRKTFFALQLCCALAAGRPFCGFMVPKARRVLMVNAEVTAKHFHRRLKKVHEGFFSLFEPAAKPLGDRLKILNSRGMALTDEIIARLAEEAKAEVILLDPLYKLLMGDECDQERVSILLARFDALAAKTGAAVVYVHHDGKGATGDRALRDRGSGSSLLNRDFDACFALSPHADNEDEAILDILLRNYAPQAALGLRFRDCTWVVEGDVTMRPETSATRREKTKEVWTPTAHLESALALITGPVAIGELLPKLVTLAGGRNKGRDLLDLVKASPRVVVAKEKSCSGRVIITPVPL